VSSLRPHARVTDPDGRVWEIYAFKLHLPWREPPDPPALGPEGVPTPGGAFLEATDGIAYIVGWLPRLLYRLLVDLPVAAVRAARSDEWTIEAVSWAPFRESYRWTTVSASRGQVLAQIEGGLARGEAPRPRHATFLGT